MLDGRVLGASQVEYKPFGKPPLKRDGMALGKAHCVGGRSLPCGSSDGPAASRLTS